MTKLTLRRIDVNLRYHQGKDDPERGVFATRPVDPSYTNELTLNVYADDDSTGLPPALAGVRLQIEFAGTARALEEFGTYLIALARLESPDPDPHEHFEDVGSETGETVHLIVRRQ